MMAEQKRLGAQAVAVLEPEDGFICEIAIGDALSLCKAVRAGRGEDERILEQRSRLDAVQIGL